jgi:drug/metabolite transporter (DMT)-like permease
MKKKLKSLVSLLKKKPLFFIIIGIIGLGIHPILYVKGYSLLSASTTVVMFYTYPIMMILLSSILFKDKLSFGSVISVLVGFIGVFILVTNGNLSGFTLNVGTILTLLAAFCWALFSIIIKYKKVDVDIGMFLFNLFGFLFLCGMIPFFGVTFSIGIKPLLGLIYLGVFPTAIALLIWNKSLHLVSTSTCSNIALLTPVLSIILIFVVLGDLLIFSQLIGMVIVLGSVMLNMNIKRTLTVFNRYYSKTRLFNLTNLSHK